MKSEMIYLTDDELKERLIQLLYFLGTDRQEYYIESMLRYLKFSIKEKVHAQEFKNPNS